MKKHILSGFVITSMLLSPALRADEALEPPATEENEGTLVGQGSDDGARTAKSKQWQNIAIAVGAVAVAVTALILVASNDGHK